MDERRRRWWSALLLVALLPSALFLGHWGLVATVPILDAQIVLVPAEAGHHDHPSGDHGQEDSAAHSRHCHGGVATCSDVPYAGASGFALLSKSVALLGSAPTVSACSEFVCPAALFTPGPDPYPPQFSLARFRKPAG